MPLSEVINRPCALSDDCVCSSTFPFVQSHNLLDLICCTYKDGDGSQVAMNSAGDCSYQGMYIAYFYITPLDIAFFCFSLGSSVVTYVFEFL